MGRGLEALDNAQRVASRPQGNRTTEYNNASEDVVDPYNAPEDISFVERQGFNDSAIYSPSENKSGGSVDSYFYME